MNCCVRLLAVQVKHPAVIEMTTREGMQAVVESTAHDGSLAIVRHDQGRL